MKLMLCYAAQVSMLLFLIDKLSWLIQTKSDKEQQLPGKKKNKDNGVK